MRRWMDAAVAATLGYSRQVKSPLSRESDPSDYGTDFSATAEYSKSSSPENLRRNYSTNFSATVEYSKSSSSVNHRATSCFASSMLPEACTRLATAMPLAVA